jgi:hypothetical protein
MPGQHGPANRGASALKPGRRHGPLPHRNHTASLPSGPRRRRASAQGPRAPPLNQSLGAAGGPPQRLFICARPGRPRRQSTLPAAGQLLVANLLTSCWAHVLVICWGKSRMDGRGAGAGGRARRPRGRGAPGGAAPQGARRLRPGEEAREGGGPPRLWGGRPGRAGGGRAHRAAAAGRAAGARRVRGAPGLWVLAVGPGLALSWGAYQYRSCIRVRAPPAGKGTGHRVGAGAGARPAASAGRGGGRQAGGWRARARVLLTPKRHGRRPGRQRLGPWWVRGRRSRVGAVCARALAAAEAAAAASTAARPQQGSAAACARPGGGALSAGLLGKVSPPHAAEGAGLVKRHGRRRGRRGGHGALRGRPQDELGIKARANLRWFLGRAPAVGARGCI